MDGLSGLDEARNLFARGRIAELVARTDLQPGSVDRLDEAHRALVAHALALTGRSSVATALASRLTQSSHGDTVRSHAHTVLALCAQTHGNLQPALFHAEAAVVLGERSGDLERATWAHLGLLRLCVDTRSLGDLDATMTQAGRFTRQAGLAHTSAYYHECLSILDGQRGRLADARRHCEIAEALLAQSPNLALLGSLLLNRSCIRCLACDFSGALDDVRRARACIEQSGLSRSAGTASNNRGYLELVTGRFDAARQSFLALLRDPSATPLIALGALDGLARAYLVADAVDRCESALARIDAQRAHDDIATLYHVRWSALTAIKVSLRRGDAARAVRDAAHLEELADRTGDVLLRASACLLSARAYQALGQPVDAARQLSTAAATGACRAPQLLPDYCFHAAGLIDETDPLAARALRGRARRLWQAQGADGLLREAERYAPTGHHEPAGIATNGPRVGTAGVTPLATLVGVAGCLEVADSPALLARELVELNRQLTGGADAALLTGTQPPESAGDSARDTLYLGEEAGTHYALRLGHADDPSRAVSLAALRAIGRASIALRQRMESVASGEPDPQVVREAADGATPTEMETIRATARRVASTDTTVLISGETGTGKELLARFIHDHSTYKDGPFVPFNCAAIARDLFDAQLFGHRRGAFTGAADHAPGMIRAAAGGTLFLDEIGEMAPDTQPKLLRFLESGEVQPVGETRPVTVQVRIIAATNADMESLIAEGRFREDLFYRLGIVRFHLPPLRGRRDEIVRLARQFLRRFAAQYGKGLLRLEPRTETCLLRYAWPGNIRQLSNEMKRVAALAGANTVVHPADLTPDVRQAVTGPDSDEPHWRLPIALEQPMAAAVSQLESAQVRHALRVSGGHAGRAAALLGLSRKGLYLKRRRYGIGEPGSSETRS